MSMVPPLHRCREHYLGECVPKQNYEVLFGAYLALWAVATKLGVCSRCTKPIRDFEPPKEGEMTAGYYVAAATNWKKYANHGEVYICDACMWSDPRYIADYGVTPQSETEPT